MNKQEIKTIDTIGANEKSQPCNCISNITDTIKEMVSNKLENQDDVSDINVDLDLSITVIGNRMMATTSTIANVSYLKKEKWKKKKTIIAHSFCPFCGVKKEVSDSKEPSIKSTDNQESQRSELVEEFYLWANSFFQNEKFERFIQIDEAKKRYESSNSIIISYGTFLLKLKMWCQVFGYKFNQTEDTNDSGRIFKKVNNRTREFIFISKQKEVSDDK